MMFRTAELGRKVSKEEFDQLAPALRIELVDLQQKLRTAGFPVLLVFAGVDGAGKGESVNLINEWMDPRWIETHAYGDSTDEERQRPEYWRYWRDLPANGKIGCVLRSWYSAPVLDHAHGRISDPELDERLARINTHEKMLADDGALILKFWMHLSKDEQRKRLKKLEKDPNESWRISKTDWANWERYDQFIAAAERTIRVTSAGHAPWSIVEGTDPRYRSLSVLTTIRDAALRHMEALAMKKRLAAALREEEKKKVATIQPTLTDTADGPHVVADIGRQGTGMVSVRLPHQPTVLEALDMKQTLTKKDYNSRLAIARARLHHLFRQAKTAGISTTLMFEGWDAAGKGGTIRRITSSMDSGDFKVIPIAAPTDEEKAHHYLWRFWRHLGRAGHATIYDRSWYGRVLVERIEGFATTEEWMRAYGEINDFEEQLVDSGMVLGKFWLHITKEEQLTRFKDRQSIPWKQWKLTDEDWRNRDKWDDYESAVNDMIERTSTRKAPWTLIEANDKQFARVKVVETVIKKLEEALERRGLLVSEKKKDK
ncbi:polyphosphate kinase [Insolitispirillum peregrinum]|uniref:polyphosphate kinase n=1 Tax=Insolitispirillum peregrinum TaxID=80876 RepID=UPI00360D9BB2